MDKKIYLTMCITLVIVNIAMSLDIATINYYQSMINRFEVISGFKLFQKQEKWSVIFLEQCVAKFVEFQNGIGKEFGGIEKKIHQIWLGKKGVPLDCIEYMRTWCNKYPGWKYYLWTDKSVEQFPLINKKFFDKSTNMGQKADILRYEILYRYGGLYVDVDFECIDFKSFDFLHEHCDFYAGALPPEGGFVVANGLIGCKSNHPLMLHIIQSLPESWDSWSEIINQTGPQFFTEAIFKKYDDIVGVNLILPSNFFYPYSWVQKGLTRKEMLKKESIALHHWKGSWMK